MADDDIQGDFSNHCCACASHSEVIQLAARMVQLAKIEGPLRDAAERMLIGEFNDWTEVVENDRRTRQMKHPRIPDSPKGISSDP